MLKVSLFVAAVAVLGIGSAVVAMGCGDEKPAPPAAVKLDAPKAPETPAKPAEPVRVDPPKSPAVAEEVAYTPVNLQGGGTISGQIKVKDPPKRKKINMDADPKCAAMHAEKVLAEEVVADAEGNVQWAFVYVKKGLEGKKFAVPPTAVVLDQKGCRYEPHVLGVMAGQEILIRNSDDLLHNIHPAPFNNKEFNIAQPSKGMEEKRMFGNVEVMIQIKCNVHPWMTAWAGVLDHPFHAVTDAAGKYTIKGLPAGKYTVEAWQEKYTNLTAEVSVTEGAAATQNFEFVKKRGE